MKIAHYILCFAFLCMPATGGTQTVDSQQKDVPTVTRTKDKKGKKAKTEFPAKATPDKTRPQKPVVYGKHGRKDDPDAASKAYDYIIKKYRNELNDSIVARNLDILIAKHYKRYRNNPMVYKNIASAFWYNNADTARAMNYADKAIALDSHYVPAYIIKGEVWAWCKDTIKAQEWYERAITANPKDAKGYEALARLYMLRPDPSAAERCYARARMAIPSYPANLKTARMYDARIARISAGKLKEDVSGTSMTNVVRFFDKAERDSMECSDYSSYAGWLYASGKLDKAYYAKALDMADQGLGKWPADVYLNRMALYSAVESRQYKNTQAYADALFASKDSTINHQDYRYLARAEKGKGNMTKAIDAFATLLAQKDATDEDRSYAVGQIAEAYKEMGEYEKADKAYTDYIAQRKAAHQLTFYDLWQYAQMYMDKASESNGEAVTQAYLKADEIYGEAAKLGTDQSDIALYQQVSIRSNEQVDPGYKKGLAVEPAKRLVALLQAMPSLEGNRKAFMITACNYLGFYYLRVKEDKRQCLTYWQKLHQVDPSNANAITVLTKIFKQKI